MCEKKLKKEMTQLDLFFKKKFGSYQRDSLLQYITSESVLIPPYAPLFNAYFYWILDEVLTSACFKLRAKVLKQMIKMGQFFFKTGNYGAFLKTLSALNQPAITRLKLSWKEVSTKYTGWLLDQIALFLNGSGDLLRSVMLSQLHPYFPDLSIFKKDYTRAYKEGSHQQMNKISHLIGQLHHYFAHVPEQKSSLDSCFVLGVEKWMKVSEEGLKERFFNRSCLLE